MSGERHQQLANHSLTPPGKGAAAASPPMYGRALALAKASSCSRWAFSGRNCATLMISGFLEPSRGRAWGRTGRGVLSRRDRSFVGQAGTTTAAGNRCLRGVWAGNHGSCLRHLERGGVAGWEDFGGRLDPPPEATDVPLCPGGVHHDHLQAPGASWSGHLRGRPRSREQQQGSMLAAAALPRDRSPLLRTSARRHGSTRALSLTAMRWRRPRCCCCTLPTRPSTQGQGPQLPVVTLEATPGAPVTRPTPCCRLIPIATSLRDGKGGGGVCVCVCVCERERE